MSSVKTIAFCSTILLLATLSTSWASGLEEAEVLSPIVSPTQPCKISVVTNETDCDQALFYYAVAVGQETQKAHLSAGNMVRSHKLRGFNLAISTPKQLLMGMKAQLEMGSLKLLLISKVVLDVTP